MDGFGKDEKWSLRPCHNNTLYKSQLVRGSRADNETSNTTPCLQSDPVPVGGSSRVVSDPLVWPPGKTSVGVARPVADVDDARSGSPRPVARPASLTLVNTRGAARPLQTTTARANLSCRRATACVRVSGSAGSVVKRIGAAATVPLAAAYKGGARGGGPVSLAASHFGSKRNKASVKSGACPPSRRSRLPGSRAPQTLPHPGPSTALPRAGA